MGRLLGRTVAALAVAVLVGCTGPGAGSTGADSGTAVGGGAPQPGVPAEPEAAPADEDRQVVTTASTTLVVEDPLDGAQQVSELVESAGGRVDERTEQAASGDDDAQGAGADLVVRVPADELTGLLADLADLGEVENVSVSGSDVTATAVDLDARISALQTSVARLQALMDAAASTDALLAAEAALSERQEQLESLQSQRTLLAEQVELSTLHVHLRPFGVAPPGGPQGFGDGLGTGWRALVSALSAAVVVVGVLLPWLAVGGLVAAGVVVPIRLSRRRTAVSEPPPPQE